MTFILKSYEVIVSGFPQWHVYLARNAARARADAWRSYCSYDSIEFGAFLKISTIRRAADVAGLGRPVLVGGEAAHWCGYNGQYVRFVRPSSDLIFLSHPLDVQELPLEGPAA